MHEAAKLTEAQQAVLVLWRDGAASAFAKGIRGSARMPFVRQCVRKGLLETQSTLPFAARRQRVRVLTLTPAGRIALEKMEGDRQ